jgi:hypothetical protein
MSGTNDDSIEDFNDSIADIKKKLAELEEEAKLVEHAGAQVSEPASGSFHRSKRSRSRSPTEIHRNNAGLKRARSISPVSEEPKFVNSDVDYVEGHSMESAGRFEAETLATSRSSSPSILSNSQSPLTSDAAAYVQASSFGPLPSADAAIPATPGQRPLSDATLLDGENLLQLTGNSLVFKEGDRVEGQFQSGPIWYAATISAVNSNGTFNLRYDDEDREEGVPKERIKPLFYPDNWTCSDGTVVSCSAPPATPISNLFDEKHGREQGPGNEWKVKLGPGEFSVNLLITFGKPNFVSRVRVFSHCPDALTSSDYSIVALLSDPHEVLNLYPLTLNTLMMLTFLY